MCSFLFQICFLTLLVCLPAIDVSDELIGGLIKRIRYIEEQGNQYAHHLKSLESRMSSQNKRLQHRISELEKEITTLKQMQHRTKGVAVVNSRSHRSLNTEPIGFHALIKNGTSVDHIGVNQNIVFPDVLLNLGAGYHNRQGVFIAPRSGLYLFSVSILAQWTGHVTIVLHLMKNGEVLANAYANGASGGHDQGSVTVLTKLNIGDEVWVSLYMPADGGSLWGDSCDSFMGLLVHEM